MDVVDVEKFVTKQLDETQVHAWIHPDGMFEMNIKAKDREELEQIIQLLSTIVERY